VIRVWSVAFLLAAAVVVAAEPGTVKGTISGAAGPVADAVILIDTPAQPTAPDAPHAVIRQRDMKFSPHVLAVAAGTTVDFPNDDTVLHNVVSSSSAKRFDLGMYPQGETRSVTFDNAGVVEIECHAHPAMSAFVVVNSGPYVAVTDARGGYTIAGVPAGRHPVRVWHETLAERMTTVDVTAGGVQALDVRLEPRH
jgi:plastocyanin